MKKPNKIYRKLGGKRSRAGQAFAKARHPIIALRDAFGWDKVARDAAENFSGMTASKRTFQMVMATVATWGKSERGYKSPFQHRLSWLFRRLNTPVALPRPAQPKIEPE